MLKTMLLGAVQGVRAKMILILWEQKMRTCRNILKLLKVAS